MRLYYSPNACSLSPHIVLRELGVPFELEKVDLRGKQTASGRDYWAVNPKGYVPALELDDGQVLTEGAIIIQYLADRFPEKRLAPANGSMERVRLQEWLHYIATELHKGMSPLYNPKATDELKAALRERLRQRFGILAKRLDASPYVAGDQFSIADPYAFYVLRAWKRLGPDDLTGTPSLLRFFEAMTARPAVQAALAAEAAT